MLLVQMNMRTLMARLVSCRFGCRSDTRMFIIWNFSMYDLYVLVGVTRWRVFVEVLMESETKWANLW